jgi:hypothetical protein
MANVGFVTGVNELMGLQMSFCDELLLARPVTAHKGPFSCLKHNPYLSHLKFDDQTYMRPKMSLQVAGLREFLQAFEEGAGKCAMLASGSLCLVET